jgi:hypothetical protein
MGTVSVSILLILKRSAHASFELSRTHGRFGHWSSDHCIALVCFQRHGVAASWNPCNSQNAFQWASNRDEALCLYPSSEHLSSLLLQRCRASHPTVQACSLSAHVRHFSPTSFESNPCKATWIETRLQNATSSDIYPTSKHLCDGELLNSSSLHRNHSKPAAASHVSRS